MPMRVSDSTLEQFRQAAAGQQPTPAGVAVAGVAAAFALGLLVKVLTISGRRKALPDASARLESLAAAAQGTSQRLLQLAGDDSAAFEACLTARRMPHATDAESQLRQQVLNSAIARVIELPLEAARQAAAGLQLCSETSASTPSALAADLGVAVTLLASGLRSFLLCAESNVRQLPPDTVSYRERLANETQRHERTLSQAEAMLQRLGATIDTDAKPDSDS